MLVLVLYNSMQYSNIIYTCTCSIQYTVQVLVVMLREG